jgi:voltage-gated potassium channel Kch
MRAERQSSADAASPMGSWFPQTHAPEPPTVTSAPKRLLCSTGALGLPDDHLLILAFDLLFVITSFTSAIFAVTAVDPHTVDLVPGEPLFAVMVAWNTLDSIFLWLWIVSRFHAQTRCRSEPWLINDTLGSIRHAYLRSTFVLDLIVALPIDLVLACFSWRLYFGSQARHFIRVPRSICDPQRSNPLAHRREWFSFVWLLCFFAFLVHVLSTGFADLEDRTYLDALYFTVLSVTSVGYGDVTATTRSGRIFTIFLMLVGVALFSIVTAYATAFMTVRDPLEEQESARRRLVLMLFEAYKVPWAVQREVIASFPGIEAAQLHGRDFATLVGNLPPDTRATVSAFAHRTALGALFPDAPDAALQALAERVSVRWLAAGAVLMGSGEPCTTAHVVFTGTIAEPGRPVLGPGAAVGLSSLIGSSPVVSPSTFTAVSTCEVLVISRDAFAAAKSAARGDPAAFALAREGSFVMFPDAIDRAAGPDRGDRHDLRPLMINRSD